MSTTASDHCLVSLLVEKRIPPKHTKRGFYFGEMLTCSERCKEVIERAWDPLRESPEFQIQDRIKSCQSHLQRWNRKVLGNVNKTLKQ